MGKLRLAGLFHHTRTYFHACDMAPCGRYPSPQSCKRLRTGNKGINSGNSTPLKSNLTSLLQVFVAAKSLAG